MPYKDSKKQRAWRKDYDASHHKEILARQRVYNENHLDERQTYRDVRREEKQAYNREYNASRLEEHRIYEACRRARKRGLPDTLTQEQWEALLRLHKYRCFYCGNESKEGEVLEQDHIIPLTKDDDGIGTVVWNIVPACRSCNSAKGNRPAPKEPVVRLML